jgi:prepilin peptidase CpaA
MNGIAPAALSVETALLLRVAVIDVATRSIDNETCLARAQMGIASRFAGPTHIAGSLVAATILFLLPFVVRLRGQFFDLCYKINKLLRINALLAK